MSVTPTQARILLCLYRLCPYRWISLFEIEQLTPLISGLEEERHRGGTVAD